MPTPPSKAETDSVVTPTCLPVIENEKTFGGGAAADGGAAVGAAVGAAAVAVDVGIALGVVDGIGTGVGRVIVAIAGSAKAN